MKSGLTLLTNAALISLLGCASNSGVFSVAPDTYRVATRATWELGGRAGATRMALAEATDFCIKKGQSLRVITNSESYGHFEGGQVDMTFTCETIPPKG